MKLSITELEGRGRFLGQGASSLEANPGDVLISDISEPHGIRAETDMRVLVVIAPPIECWGLTRLPEKRIIAALLCR